VHVPQAQQALKARAHARLLPHLAHGGRAQIFPEIRVAARKLPRSCSRTDSFFHDEYFVSVDECTSHAYVVRCIWWHLALAIT
jgi:hypothetical protein